MPGSITPIGSFASFGLKSPNLMENNSSFEKTQINIEI